MSAATLERLDGDMSLVGPRPLPLCEVEKFENNAQRRHLSVKSWQISGRNQVATFGIGFGSIWTISTAGPLRSISRFCCEQFPRQSWRGQVAQYYNIEQRWIGSHVLAMYSKSSRLRIAGTGEEFFEHASTRSESVFHLPLGLVAREHSLDVFGQNIELDIN
jgi:hypothetical protein